MKKYRYGIIGNGCLATHIAHYLKLEGISHICWSRSEDRSSPEEKLKSCSIILLAIKDSSITEFLLLHPNLKQKTLIHFSGALKIENVMGFHPLMTFSGNLYTKKKYRSISFIGTTEKKTFYDVFPHLKNPYYTINDDQKSLYHALCVISGNFTTILWQKVFKDFETELNLGKEVLIPYMEQIVENLKLDHKNSLTGPIKRDDKKTIKLNIKALNSKLWKKIYKLFYEVYNKELR